MHQFVCIKRGAVMVFKTVVESKRSGICGATMSDESNVPCIEDDP
jgi:hypothetical protein